MYKIGDKIKIKPEHINLYAVKDLQNKDGFLTVNYVRYCWFNTCSKRPLCEGYSYQFLNDELIKLGDDNGYCMINHVAHSYLVPSKPKPFNPHENKKTDNN